MWGKFYICSMASIKFLIKNTSNVSTIYVRFKEGLKFDLMAKTNFLVDANDWSKAKGKANDKDKEGKALNEALAKLSSNLLAHYNNCKDKNEVNIIWLKSFLNPVKEESLIPTRIVPYIDYFTLHKSSSSAPSTIKRNNVYKKLIERFEVNDYKKPLLIKDIDDNFRLRFENYCLSENYKPNTIARTIKFIKTVCYHAKEKNGIEISNSLNSIKIKIKPIEKIYLNQSDLNKIQKVKLPYDYLDNARDWLLISCGTGQRVSDFMRFDKSMIKNYKNKKGKQIPIIEFTQFKTKKRMAVALSDNVMAILNKRGGEFPRSISDQRYNEYIKEVCRLAEINEKTKGSISKAIDGKVRKIDGVYEKWQLVASHIGRKSYSTNNYGKIPTALIMKATGHSTEKMFLDYIGKTEIEHAIDIADYF